MGEQEREVELLEEELAAWKYTAEVYEKRCKALMRCGVIMKLTLAVNASATLLILLTILATAAI